MINLAQAIQLQHLVEPGPVRDAYSALIAELRAARKVVEAARTQEHEIWCDSLPRGTWVPVRCNCWQSNVWHELKAYDAATAPGGEG